MTETTDRTTRTFVFVNHGGQARDGSEFHVHTLGCSDLRRGSRYRWASSVWEMEAQTAEQAVRDQMDEFNSEHEGEGGDAWPLNSFKVFPCTKKGGK